MGNVKEIINHKSCMNISKFIIKRKNQNTKIYEQLVHISISIKKYQKQYKYLMA